VDASVLVICQGLVNDDEGLRLHPALAPWARAWLRMRRRWFHCAPQLPLSCYARLLEVEPAALLAARAQLPADTRQIWVASPYFAALGRDTLTLLPEGAFSWHEHDARWLCALLNPLLKQDRMELLPVGAAMLLCCAEPLQAQPAAFAEISGDLLPNRHAPGPDGGRLMRLVAEIQMLLHQRPAEHRRARGEADVHGLWFWGPCAPSAAQACLPVATRNAALAAVAPASQARAVISEAEHVQALMPRRMPRHVVLLGRRHALWLRRSMLPRMHHRDWRAPAKLQPESELFAQLRRHFA